MIFIIFFMWLFSAPVSSAMETVQDTSEFMNSHLFIAHKQFIAPALLLKAIMPSTETNLEQISPSEQVIAQPISSAKVAPSPESAFKKYKIIKACKEKNKQKCPFPGCGRKISGKMEYHMYVHTGEKPFVCSECDEPNAQPDNAHRHVNSKHHDQKGAGIINTKTGQFSETKFVSFCCNQPGHPMYYDKWSYKRHLKSHSEKSKRA